MMQEPRTAVVHENSLYVRLAPFSASMEADYSSTVAFVDNECDWYVRRSPFSAFDLALAYHPTQTGLMDTVCVGRGTGARVRRRC